MTMRAGQMRRTITIRTMTRTPDGMGGYTETPTDVTGVFARVEPLQGDEQVNAMQTGMLRPYRFHLRYRAGMTGAKRIIYDSRTFDIRSVLDPEEKHRELEILADEVDA